MQFELKNMSKNTNDFNHLYNDYLSECNKLEKSKILEKNTEEKLIKIENRFYKLIKNLEQNNLLSPNELKKLNVQWINLENRLNRILFKYHKQISIKKEHGDIKTSIKDLNSTQFKAEKNITNTFDNTLNYLKMSLPSLIKNNFDKINANVFMGNGRKLKLIATYNKLEKLEQRKKELESKLHLSHRIAYDLDVEEGLINETQKINDEIAQIKSKIESIEEKQVIGDKTRNNFEKIGGERVEITTPDSEHAKLDATYLDCQKFKEALKNNGGQFATITRVLSDGREEVIQAIAFNKNDITNNKNHIINTLNQLRVFIQPSYEASQAIESSGWCQVMHDDKVYLISNENILDLAKEKTHLDQLFEFDKGNKTFKVKASQASNVQIKFEEIDLSKKSTGGTVIVTGGSVGIYEMHKAEAMAFLLKGMNVMLFNFRGYGLSEGTPSTVGFHQDMEAAYEFCKNKTHQDDDKILFKALCMSGGPAAFMAAQHPETNVFLDQTYSTLKLLMEERAVEKLKEYVQIQGEKLNPTDQKEFSLQLIEYLMNNWNSSIKFFAGITAPKFDVSENLTKNQGKKGLFFVCDDEFVSREHVEKILANLAKEGKLAQTIVFSSPSGTHGASWLSLKNSPAMFDKEITKQIDDIQKNTDKKVTALQQESVDKGHAAINEANKFEQLAEEIEQKEGITEKSKELRQKAADMTIKGEEEASIIWQTSVDAKKAGAEEIRQIKLNYEPNLFISSYTAQTQMNHFLSKAKLSDPLLKTSHMQRYHS